ncbi:MAG: SGNH/GDSL hydrolase family protein [gamma proteobacterium symbiont of Lucinoma myriamae]|nr:SGNH/GDSL hydrolase family protein [gamma proteobacterium symbiont of Lucinoma myriamae]
MEHVGQRVPVIITHRVPQSLKDCERESTQNNSLQNSRRTDRALTSTGKILLIGDSILHGVNTKGLVTGVQKHSKSGATVNDIISEISMYDLKSFDKYIVYVGGNDCSKHTDEELYEEKYDQLISLIKTANPNGEVYICKIAPRGDTDVSSFNNCIDRLANHWRKHNVKCVQNTCDYFYGQNKMPTGRYYASDGIHLSHCGVKRLLDAINSSVKLIVEFNACVFGTANIRETKYASNGRRGNLSYHSQSQTRRNITRQQHEGSRFYKDNRGYSGGYTANTTGSNRYSRRRCYGCQMTGHVISECWNVQ